MTYLYLAPNIEKTGIKIGFSVEPTSRLNGVVGNIDYKKTYIFECKNVASVEDFCHKYFSEFSINLYESGDGHTEWFDICIRKVAKDLILRNMKLLGIIDHFNYLDRFDKTITKTPLQDVPRNGECEFDIYETYQI